MFLMAIKTFFSSVIMLYILLGTHKENRYVKFETKNVEAGVILKIKNQKWYPLRAMKTIIRKKVGHTT